MGNISEDAKAVGGMPYQMPSLRPNQRQAAKPTSNLAPVGSVTHRLLSAFLPMPIATQPVVSLQRRG